MTTIGCKIIDNQVVLRDGSIISVPQDYFGDPEQTDCYFGKVLKMIDNGKQVRVQWFQDNTKSIEDVDNLQLETEFPPKSKNKFILHIKPQSSNNSNIHFQADSTLASVDSSTPGFHCCLLINDMLLI